jgi:hypothetical protein
MFGAQRFGNRVLLRKPFPQVHEFATSGTEWAVSSRKPIAFSLARGTFDPIQLSHTVNLAQRADGPGTAYLRPFTSSAIATASLRSGLFA